MLAELFTPIVVFYAIYRIIKEILDFSLKKKIINSGHFDKAEILKDPLSLKERDDINKYPALKWGLVFLFTGLGFIISGVLDSLYDFQSFNNRYFGELLLSGIVVTSISLGFLIYFIIVIRKR